MISVNINGKLVDNGYVLFSDGSVSYTIKAPDVSEERIVYVTYLVSTELAASSVIDHLTQCKDAVDNALGGFYSVIDHSLILQYLPYARHDRRFSEGNNFGLQNFLFMLDYIGFDNVTLYDPHSNVFKDNFFQKTEVRTQLDCFKSAQTDYYKLKTDWDYVIAPDKGAVEKSKTIADYLGLPLVVCTKDRDPLTGKLSNPVVTGEVSGKCLIVDDIGDGMYTFLQLGMELKRVGATQVDLYVTHLIGAKGLDILKPVIDKITCYQIIGKYLTMADVINFNKGETNV